MLYFSGTAENQCGNMKYFAYFDQNVNH